MGTILKVSVIGSGATGVDTTFNNGGDKDWSIVTSALKEKEWSMLKTIMSINFISSFHFFFFFLYSYFTFSAAFHSRRETLEEQHLGSLQLVTSVRTALIVFAMGKACVVFLAMTFFPEIVISLALAFVTFVAMMLVWTAYVCCP